MTRNFFAEAMGKQMPPLQAYKTDASTGLLQAIHRRYDTAEGEFAAMHGGFVQSQQAFADTIKDKLIPLVSSEATAHLPFTI